MRDSPEPKKRKWSTESTDDESDSTAPVTNLRIKRLSDKAKLPTRGSALAAGYDLYRFGHALYFIVVG
jgi:dUTP pyrophosphatase